ncbi:hypothetical protein EGW08_017973 [Elysia chlorotica]|uniref:MARVEL domain-containing protein n=1 Tax=Elysia chlorotica TaxID=188477 RepID=A0A3S1B817_ELYCH|nr:hypothetical protein EGW08_017973 [Elysia chlorotica]
MGRIPKTTLSSKFLLGFSCVCILLYSIAISQQYWLRFRTTQPPKPPKYPFPVRIKVHMGLFRACKNAKAEIPQGTLIIEDWCRSKHAPDWHKACAAFGILAFLAAMTQNLLALFSVTWTRMANKLVYKLVSAACSAVSVGFMIPILILFDVNRDNYRGVHYDLYYCYVLGVIGMVFYFFLTIMILADAYYYRNHSEPCEEKLWTEETNGESSTRYT